MNLLLDTHILLWWLADDPALPRVAREAIGTEPDVVVSAASAWEISIKRALGKLVAPDDLDGALREQGFAALPITITHATQAGALPRHHADPFDRMLIAQAQAESLRLVTVDSQFSRYDVALLL